MTLAPSHADQIDFLARVQKILDEGQFVATYKFALLIALIEIAIERGDDSGAPLDLKIDWIAEKFIELYWGHAMARSRPECRADHQDDAAPAPPTAARRSEDPVPL